MNRARPEPNPPASYVIDVCSTCGRQAIYPFCAHRTVAGRWTYPLVVSPTAGARRGLLEHMRKRARYDERVVAAVTARKSNQ